MEESYLLSICIPCYGRIDYVRNTLKSIFEDNKDVPLSEYEVVISDNDPNHEIEILTKEFKYKNLKYYTTECEGFMNSYYVLTYAKGKLLKLHNSQVTFKKGTLANLLNEIKDNDKYKPLIFYTNGFLFTGISRNYQSFDTFLNAMSYWTSWSNGFSIWNEDFNRLKDLSLNKLFPHTSLLITQHYKKDYIVNDKHWFDTQRVVGRSGHNKFEAFTIEYPSLIDICYQKNWISKKTKKHILNKIMTEFLPILLFNKYVVKIENYDITGYSNNIKKYFPFGAYWITWLFVMLVPFKLLYRKVKHK